MNGYEIGGKGELLKGTVIKVKNLIADRNRISHEFHSLGLLL